MFTQRIEDIKEDIKNCRNGNELDLLNSTLVLNKKLANDSRGASSEMVASVMIKAKRKRTEGTPINYECPKVAKVKEIKKLYAAG